MDLNFFFLHPKQMQKYSISFCISKDKPYPIFKLVQDAFDIVTKIDHIFDQKQIKFFKILNLPKKREKLAFKTGIEKCLEMENCIQKLRKLRHFETKNGKLELILTKTSFQKQIFGQKVHKKDKIGQNFNVKFAHFWPKIAKKLQNWTNFNLKFAHFSKIKVQIFQKLPKIDLF